MKRFLIGLILFLAPATGWAACVPTAAKPGMPGCQPIAGTVALTDYVQVWIPDSFPASAQLIQVQNLIPSVTGFLPLTGGTVTGLTTFSHSGTGLAVTNNETIGGTLDVGGAVTVGGVLNVAGFNVTSAQGIQFSGTTALFVTTGLPFQQGVYVGPRAGAFMAAGNIPQAFGMAAVGVASLESLTTAGAEAACFGAFSCQYATTAFGLTGIGEHTIGYDNSPFMTAVGNDSMRDTIGCASCTALGASSQGDGVASTNTSVGAFALRGNAGSITITGNPTAGDVYHVAFATTNPNVVGLPLTVNVTASSANPISLATGLASAITALNSTVTYLLPSGRTTWTDNGVGLSAFSVLTIVQLHFPGGQAAGWDITPTTSCTGTCTATLTTAPAFSGTDNIAIGTHALDGLSLTTGSGNVAIGDSALAVLAGSSSNLVCIGNFACAAAKTSSGTSVVLGTRGAWLATDLTNDVIINAGNALTTGIDNTFINSAGNVTTGSGNLELGSAAAVPSNVGNWQMSLANVIYGTNTNLGAAGAMVGINTSAPGAVLDVLGSDVLNATIAFRVRNSTPANIFSVRDDGTISEIGPHTVTGGSLTLGVANTTGGSLVLEGATSGSVTVNPPAVAGSTTVILTHEAKSQAQPSNPTAPSTTASYKMQGLAGTITPASSGTVLLAISGTVTSATNTSGDGISYQLSYGTGAAPANAATLAGTQVGTIQTYKNPTAVTAANVAVPFAVHAVVTGLSVGTAYWIDLAAQSIATNSSGTLSAVSVSAIELQ